MSVTSNATELKWSIKISYADGTPQTLTTKIGEPIVVPAGTKLLWWSTPTVPIDLLFPQKDDSHE